MPEPSLKGNYGKVDLKAVLSALNTLQFKYRRTFKFYHPMTYEAMKFNGAYVLYEVDIPWNNTAGHSIDMSIPVRDRAFLYKDDVSILNCFLSLRNSLYLIKKSATTFHSLIIPINMQFVQKKIILFDVL